MFGIESSVYVAGHQRTCQDAAAVVPTSEGAVAVVADGAGGIGDGEIAAADVVSAIRSAAARRVEDWTRELQSLDARVSAGESTACVIELSRGGLRGASVGDCRAGILIEDDLDFLTDEQRRKPLLGTGGAIAVGFSRSWQGGTVILGSDGFWNGTSVDRIVATARAGDFAVLAKSLAELARLPSGGFADDVAVVCLRARRPRPPRTRIDLLADV